MRQGEVIRFFKINGDKNGESTLQHHRPPPLLGARRHKAGRQLCSDA
jgi:hypothetical protein